MRLYGISAVTAALNGLINLVDAVSCENVAVLFRECADSTVICAACDHKYIWLGTNVSELHFALLHTAGVLHEHIAAGGYTGSRTSSADVSEEVWAHKSAVDSFTSSH